MIRLASERDSDEIASIYNQAVAARFATGDTKPVSIASRRLWLAEHDATRHPVFVTERAGSIVGWCSLSPYRAGRQALRYTSELSYFVRYDWHRRGIASSLIDHALGACEQLGIKTLIAIVLERNMGSGHLLDKKGFRRWGFLPQVADFGGEECGHIYYGRRLSWHHQEPGSLARSDANALAEPASSVTNPEH